MKILGIDWGKRTLGIAISNGKLGLAFPRPSIKNDKKAMNSLAEIIHKERISMIVVGHPLRMNGEDSESTDGAKEFYEKLKKKLKIEVVLFDERFTTKVVETAMNRENETRKKIREKKDSLSAVIILQNYIDANKE